MGAPLELKTTLNLPKTDFPMKANLPQNEPKMLAQRHVQGTAAKQQFPQLRWREKFHRKQGSTIGKQAAPKKIRLAARRRYDSRRLFVLQSATGNSFKPMVDYVLPRRFRRSSDVQRYAPRMHFRFAACVRHLSI